MGKPIGTPVTNGCTTCRVLGFMACAFGLTVVLQSALLKETNQVLVRTARENAELRSRRIEVLGSWPNEYRLRWADASGVLISEPADVSTRFVCRNGQWVPEGEIRLSVESDDQ